MNNTIAEQISLFEAKRQASVGRSTEIMNKASDEGRTLDEVETNEYDNLASEIKAVDSHIARLKVHETTLIAKATPVAVQHGDEQNSGSAVRANSGIISVGPRLEPGQKMARYAMALWQAKGNPGVALGIVQNNQRWMDQTPELAKVFMAAVAAGDTTTAGWASELVYAQNLASEFIEFLRPMTIVGRLTGLRRVPFNVRMGSQTAGSTAYWVGQANPIPVSKLTTGSLSLGITKLAGLLVIDDELMRNSSPSAELLVRNDLAAQIAQYMDVSFIDPNLGGVANVQPASMLYGVTPITPSGTNASALAVDVAALFAAPIAAGLDPTTGVFIMTPTTALKLSLMMNSLGQRQYPDININGGNLLGLPAIVSQTGLIAGSPQFGAMIVLLIQNEILLADDGQVTIDISNQASIQMLDNPTNSGAGGTVATTMVSMYQTVSEAIRGVRYVNWVKRRASAAQFIQAAAYA